MPRRPPHSIEYVGLTPSDLANAPSEQPISHPHPTARPGGQRSASAACDRVRHHTRTAPATYRPRLSCAPAPAKHNGDLKKRTCGRMSVWRARPYKHKRACLHCTFYHHLLSHALSWSTHTIYPIHSLPARHQGRKTRKTGAPSFPSTAFTPLHITPSNHVQA